MAGTHGSDGSDAEDRPGTAAARDPLSRYLEAAMGLTDLTRRRAEKLVRNVLKQGETAGNPKELVESLLERSNENRGALVTLIRGETKRAMKAMGVATTNDVERLEQQLKALRRQLADAQEEAGTSSQAEERAAHTAAMKTAERSSSGGKKAAKKAKKAKKTTNRAEKATETKKNNPR